MSISGITFDLWDTLVHDDSDEAKRQAQGLPGKYEQRRLLVWESLEKSRSLAEVSLAYDAVDAAFNKVWKEHHITWPIAERLDLVLRGLNEKRPPRWDELLEKTSRMEVDIPPDLIEGCAETLAELSKDYQLAIVSDAIVTPGARLRDLLENHGIKHHFSAFAFSDEVGHSKPHAGMFHSVLQTLELPPEEVVHIGDRDHNDVKGSQGMGMKSILFTATRDLDRNHTTADAICDSYADLRQTIQQLGS